MPEKNPFGKFKVGDRYNELTIACKNDIVFLELFTLILSVYVLGSFQ
jgi:hypothetical protein